MKQDKAELLKQKVIVTSVAVATTKFLFGMCDGVVDSDVGTSDFSLNFPHAITCVRTWTAFKEVWMTVNAKSDLSAIT